MNTTSKKLQKILEIKEKDRIKFERDLIQFALIQIVQDHMGDKNYSHIAKEMGVSKSFVSQVFSGDKKINLDILAKFQRILKFKFKFGAASMKQEKESNNRIIPMWYNAAPTSFTTTQQMKFQNVEFKINDHKASGF